ncbi:glutamate--cysteine ligase [Agarilytica rhodophyticola]|uniref:glutamate--cysteine ligase n=1 Tax=Agarilytica rhodophyticola TaxID=1737490 RepID=UPI000B345D07|nr:glutamate--cysteine ligase [Agarilytica rhodophyticola]
MFEIESLPKGLFDKKNTPLLSGILRGVEREALRTNLDGQLSLKPHPKGLGSALMHPQITTDFSESLLEFITPPTHQVDDLLYNLEAIQKFVVSQLEDEILWATSMPCSLGKDSEIPVAQYGSSNNGLMKTIYRIGLGHRYGRSMQTVAGIHYNFSLPNAFWAFLHQEQNSLDELQDFKDKGYFNLIRNFRRHYWLLIYLFGSSPAICKSFVAGKDHHLQMLDDGHTLHLPYATSLRMGDLGYQSTVQESLYVCYNDMLSYIKTLCCAITQPHPTYEAIGTKDDSGKYKQLNNNILQIENEFYSSIRPKRTARSGETALSALQNRGVEYIEVRCLDVNPYSPLGITREQIYFLDTFLVYCALQQSPPTDKDEAAKILRNQKRVVNFGRQPNLKLEHNIHGETDLSVWGIELIEAMRPVAELLDASNHTEGHQASLEMQKSKLVDSSKTPSAKIINKLSENNLSFAKYALDLSSHYNQFLSTHGLPESITKRMHHMAEESTNEQKSVDDTSKQDFDQFLADYYKQYSLCSGS